MNDTANKIPRRTAAIFDFDGTLVPNIDMAKKLGIGSHPKLGEMIAEMQAIQKDGGVIIGNTGRPPNLINGDQTGLAEMPFDYICSSVGTVILHPVQKDGHTVFERLPEYDAYLNTPSVPNKKPYNKEAIYKLFDGADGFKPQEVEKIGDSPRNGFYYTFTIPDSTTDPDAFITNKIGEVRGLVGTKLSLSSVDGYDAKVGVSKEKVEGKTVTLNVDVMPAKADKIGATKWLLEYIAKSRRTAKHPQLDSVIVAGDSSNDRSNMNAAEYRAIGLEPAFVAPGNAHHDLKKYLDDHQRENGMAVCAAPAIPSDIRTDSTEYFNHAHYGLGGTLQALSQARHVLADKLTYQQKSINHLPDSFAKSPNLLTIFHVQGAVSPGFFQMEDPKLRAIFGDPNMPMYLGDLGKGIDTGGQTMHVFEKLFYAAKSGVPSVMFTISHDKTSTSPVIQKHTDNAYVVYLPYSLIKEAGIPEDRNVIDPVTGAITVPKEVLMANRHVFDHIAKAAVHFMRYQVPGFDQKNVILSGHYIDGGQSVLSTQNILRTDVAPDVAGVETRQFTGKSISMYNPHTLGIDKMRSLLGNHLGQVTTYLERFHDLGEKYNAVANHPLLVAERAIVKAVDDGCTPDIAARMIGEHLQGYDAKLASFKAAYAELVSGFRQGVAADGKGVIAVSPDDFCANTIRDSGLYGLNQQFSFKDRLELESPDQLTQFDGLAGVSEDMLAKVERWTQGSVPRMFARNGIDTTVFSPDLAGDPPQKTIVSEAKGIIDQAHNFSGHERKLDENLLKNGTVFVAVSRPDERKGSEVAIEAFAKFLETNPNGVLLFGAHKPEGGKKSPYFQKLEALVETLDKSHPGLGLKDKVCFLPALKSYQSRLLYGLSHAVGLSPSDNEPWGIVGVEQIGSGIPVIGTDKYASISHFAGLAPKDRPSILQFPSRVNVGNEASVTAFAARMSEVAGDYERYKQNALLNSSLVKAHSSWESMTDTYLHFARDIGARRTVVKAGDIPIKAALFQDVDDCIVPNINHKGREAYPESTALRQQVSEVQKAKGVSILTTGRPMAMLESDPLMDGYPVDYAITSAGVELYEKQGNRFEPIKAYEEFLLTPPEGKTRFDVGTIRSKLGKLAGDKVLLTPQPTQNVSGQRLGYYVDAANIGHDDGARALIRHVVKRALGEEMDYQVVPSFDAELNKWNVDIMPSKASKRGAADWLLGHQLTGKVDAAIVSGNSSDDLSMMDDALFAKHRLPCAFVAPANASDDIGAHLHKYQDRADIPVSDFSQDTSKDAALHGAGGVLQGLLGVLPSLIELAKPPTAIDHSAGTEIGGHHVRQK